MLVILIYLIMGLLGILFLDRAVAWFVKTNCCQWQGLHHTIFRLSGDEFVFLIRSVEDIEAAKRMTASVIQRLSVNPFLKIQSVNGSVSLAFDGMIYLSLLRLRLASERPPKPLMMAI